VPSPFPGMNPYLEQPYVWGDFHNRFMSYASEAISTQIRPNFLVKLEEQVYIHERSGEERRKLLGRPDISVLEESTSQAPVVLKTDPQSRNQLQAIIASLPDVEVERHAYIEIRDRLERKLVTMIEVLSPTNKRYGPDREQYVAKRTAVMYSPASLVEIDLLRGGPRLELRDVPPCDYRVSIYRRPRLPEVEVWPIGLRDPLPIISIPLKGDFPDASLDLQAVLHRVYDAAGYEDYIYESLPEPPLEGIDSAWAESVLASRNGTAG
jgi:hypothetical protein